MNVEAVVEVAYSGMLVDPRVRFLHTIIGRGLPVWSRVHSL